jgi:hypothetical protein
MPSIVDYPRVIVALNSLGMRCLYHNSGAFGFAPEQETRFVGWIGPPDPTLRPAAAARAVQIRAPYESTLARMAVDAWQSYLSGALWIMPMSHWAFELNHGPSSQWLPAMLEEIGIDPEVLRPRNTGDAIEFMADESGAARQLLQRLLESLTASDFVMAFGAHRIVCTVHHHKQLWWVSTDPALIASLERA